MIICPRCSKENQDHYMFCLGCGTELKGGGAAKGPFKPSARPAGHIPGTSGAAAEAAKPAAASPKPVAAATSGGAAKAASRGSDLPPSFGGAAAPAAVPAPAPKPEALACPRCSTSVPSSFRFCGSCGFDMTTIPAAAPAEAAAPVVNDLPAGAARLVLIRPDGSEGETVNLSDDFVVGRDAGGPFAGDSYLSPQHARIKRGATSYTV